MPSAVVTLEIHTFHNSVLIMHAPLPPMVIGKPSVFRTACILYVVWGVIFVNVQAFDSCKLVLYRAGDFEKGEV